MNKEMVCLMIISLIVSGIILNYLNEDWLFAGRIVFFSFLIGFLYYAFEKDTRGKND